MVLTNMTATAQKTRTSKQRSASAEQSINRILDATLEALSRKGLNSLSMTDVCRFAGVARGTLYRYFPSKDALLESLGQRTRQLTSEGLKEASKGATNGKDALIGIINFLKGFAEESKARETLEIEPMFFIEFLARNLPSYTKLVTELLADFYDEMERDLGHKVDRQMCSEAIMRLQISYIFLPDNHSSEHLAETILNSLSHLSKLDH